MKGRLGSARLGVADLSAMPTVEGLTDADFRNQRTTPSLLGPSEHALLGIDQSLAVEPPTWTATQTTAHQLASRTLMLDGAVAETQTYTSAGGRRVADATWTYTFDDFGRLTAATRPNLRRIEYTWDPNGRLVGRTALQWYGSDGWITETRANVLAADGFPAETTFVWDPVTDRLVSVFAKGGGLLRQYLHGDQGYGDPVDVRIASTPGGEPTRYFPVIDDSGSGSLQAVLAENGDLVERVLYADAYGDAPRYLQGPVVEKISFEAKKGGDGNVESVKLRVRVSEAIVADTIAAGTRLQALNAAGTVLATYATPASFEDAHTLAWTLNASQWQTLTSSAAMLQVAVTNALRAEGWSTPAQPIPSWALTVYSGTSTSAEVPVAKRTTLADLRAFIEALPPAATETRALYEIPSLYLAASPTSKANLLFDFHAYPFRDPATQLVQVRDRWYDAATGTWLTPDPVSYADSSSLYAYCTDPVNTTDPAGTLSDKASAAWWSGARTTATTVGIGAAFALGAAVSAPVTLTGGIALGLYAVTKAYVQRSEQYDDEGMFDNHGEAFGVAVGDIAGFTGMLEGVNDTELITGRALTPREAGERLGGGVGQQVGTIFSAALYRPIIRGAQSSALYRQLSRNIAATAIRELRADLRTAEMSTSSVNSRIAAFDLESLRYNREFNFWSKHYCFFDRGAAPNGAWLTEDATLLEASPSIRKIRMALPAASRADAAAYTRIPFG